MFTFEPSVVVIDDKKEEVEGILSHYYEKGIGCKYFNAHSFDGDPKPDTCFSDVSLVFLDVYYSSDINAYNPEYCSDWIDAILPENSFYILVLWSKDIEHETEILQELRKIKKYPFCTIAKSKPIYQGKNGFDFNKLNLEIKEELDKTPSLSEMGVWKRRVKRAANSVIGGISNSGEPDVFTTKLQKIIKGHGGKMTMDISFDEKREVLFDALDRVLVSNTKGAVSDILIDEINREELYSLKFKKNIGIDKELNSWFHFNLNKNIPKTVITSGLVSEFKSKFLSKHYSIRDDSKISIRLEKQLKENVKIDDITLILTRPCDIAQNKFGKNVKLLSGIKIINPYRYVEGDLTSKQKAKKKLYLGNIHFNGHLDLPDSIQFYDHLSLSDEEPDVAILFDFRYVFSISKDTFIEKFNNIKILNKELFSEIQVEYSSYSSRLGITQII